MSVTAQGNEATDQEYKILSLLFCSKLLLLCGKTFFMKLWKERTPNSSKVMLTLSTENTD